MSQASSTVQPASRPRQLVAIVNANASAIADPERTASTVEEALAAHGDRVEATVTRSEDELNDALRRAAAGRAVLVGGDGSLHAAANAPVELPELALVPSGRANNVARQLGIPQDVTEAARVACCCAARPLDVLVVETPAGRRRCVEGLSAGLQADARSDYEGENSSDLLSGARTLVTTLMRYEPYDAELELDGHAAYRGPAAQVFASNLALFGFGFEVNPLAAPADGRLEAIVVRAPTRRAALLMLARTYRGRHLATRRAGWRRAAHAALRRPLPIACDGVPLGTTTATIGVDDRALRIAAPQAP